MQAAKTAHRMHRMTPLIGVHSCESGNRAWARFNEYNKDQDDTLTRDELLSMPELAINPLRERIAHVFSRDGTGTMTFDDFLDFLSVFNPKVRQQNSRGSVSQWATLMLGWSRSGAHRHRST